MQGICLGIHYDFDRECISSLLETINSLQDLYSTAVWVGYCGPNGQMVQSAEFEAHKRDGTQIKAAYFHEAYFFYTNFNCSGKFEITLSTLSGNRIFVVERVHENFHL